MEQIEPAGSGNASVGPAAATQAPLVEMRGIDKHFAGVHAVSDVSLEVSAGEVLGVLGHNGAGKSVLMQILAGALPRDAGEIRVGGQPADIRNPRDARRYGIETIYQTLALADNLDASANLFLGREKLTPLRRLDKRAMRAQAREVIQRLNPNFHNLGDPVRSLSGGQRQVVAIARAIHFDARLLLMDEPTAALGPAETEMVASLVRRLRADGIGIVLISHDLHDVFDLCDRVMVMKNSRQVGTHAIDDVSKDDVLSLIIKGELPPDWRPRSVD